MTVGFLRIWIFIIQIIQFLFTTGGGALIYQSMKGAYEENPWNGRWSGKELPVNSYSFIIECNDETKKSMRGNVSIILN